MILFPHCKINLGLHITARRPDGYHEIETLFYPVRGLCDALEILNGEESTSTPDTPAVHFSSTGLPLDCPTEKNLCVKAAQMLLADFPAQIPATGIRLHLHKAIPFGAGLGGGSADATATLQGVNQLLHLGLTPDELRPYAARLGSDTVFFLYDHPMLGSGRGEQLTPCDTVNLHGWWLVLVKPDTGVSTAEAYALITPHAPAKPLADVLQQPIETWRERLVNDFEEPLYRKLPLLREIKEQLYAQGATYAALSGSGSTLFGLFRQKPEVTLFQNDYFVHTEQL